MNTAARYPRSTMRSAPVALMLAVAMAAAPAFAQEADPAGGVAFGIRPVTADEQVPESYSYFLHTISPGSTRSDEVMVINEGTVPIKLDIYVADARTAINGGTAFANTTNASTDASSWITVDASRVSLRPGEQEVVPFTIDVPSAAAPGEHVAGIVVEAEPAGGGTPDGEGTQFGVEVIRRAGVAVVVDVPGPPVVSLAIDDLKIREINSDGTQFSYTVMNAGNVMVRGSGVFRVTDAEGAELASIPIEMDTVLPGDTGLFLIPSAVVYADAEYQLWVTLDYWRVLSADGVQSIALGPINASVLEGRPLGGTEGYPEVTPAIPTPPAAVGDGDTSGNPWLLVAAVVAAAVFIGSVTLLLLEPLENLIRARQKGRRPARASVVQERKSGRPDAGVKTTYVPDPFPANALFDDEATVNADDRRADSSTPGETSSVDTG